MKVMVKHILVCFLCPTVYVPVRVLLWVVFCTGQWAHHGWSPMPAYVCDELMTSQKLLWQVIDRSPSLSSLNEDRTEELMSGQKRTQRSTKKMKTDKKPQVNNNTCSHPATSIIFYPPPSRLHPCNNFCLEVKREDYLNYSVICYVVYNSHAQCYTYTCLQFLNLHVD